MKRAIYSLIVISLCFIGCKQTGSPSDNDSISDVANLDTLPIVPKPKPRTFDYDTTQWTDLKDMDSTFVLDMRYATTNNFVKAQMYDCARCFLRPNVAKAIQSANQELKDLGYGGFKFFDCYRPRSVQYKLWEIYPKPGYVADPAKGSIHNRGGAVDLTILDKDGKELDMGTDFDFFGRAANHTYTELPQNVLQNRRLLKDLMKDHGFKSIRTEWWHYNFENPKYKLADMVWECE